MLEVDKHISFIENIILKKDLNFLFTEPSRLSTLYWTLNSYNILRKEDLVEKMKQNAIDYVLKCKNEDGGFGGDLGYSSNILSTFNALQILFILKTKIEISETINFIKKNFKEDGSFQNDSFGESDVRMSCCAVLSLHILFLMKDDCFESEHLSRPIDPNFLDSIKFDYIKSVEYLMRCYNNDGGFGSVIGAESHCAHTFCCISSLRSLGAIDYINKRDIATFIALRQKENGGLSGRVNKKEDVCYSFWAYSSLVMLGLDHVINREMLTEYIFLCQSSQGGFSDRPKNEPDLYHLMFSLAALSLLGYEGLGEIDPGFAL